MRQNHFATIPVAPIKAKKNPSTCWMRTLPMWNVSNKNSIIQCYMWSSISNESSRAHKFNYPIDMPVNISRCAGIVRQLHPLKSWLLLTAFYGCFTESVGFAVLVAFFAISWIIFMPVNILRCAGISHQLHPLKAKDLIKDKVIEIDWKNDMCG